MKTIIHLLKTILVAILTLLFLAVAPSLYTVDTILWVVRALLNILKKILRPDFGDFLSGMDGLFGSEDPYTLPQTVNQMMYVVDGDVSIEEACKKMTEAALKCDRKGIPQLKQYFSTWMGFAIWKPVRHFRVQNHVRIIERSELEALVGEHEVTDENITQIGHELSSIPFRRGESPWELLICYSVRSKYTTSKKATVLFLRMHHTIGDGNVVTLVTSNMFKTGNDGKDTINLVKQAGMKAGNISWLAAMADILISIYELAHICVNRCDFNAWHRPWTRIRKTYYYQNLTAPIETVKRIRKTFNVTFSAVVCGALTGAIKRFMENRKEKVPEKMHAVVSVPSFSNNSHQLNNISCVVLEYPTKEMDSQNVCRLINTDLGVQRAAKYPALIHKLASLVSLMPQKFKFLYPGWLLTTCGGTNYPGFLNPVTFNGKRIVSYAEVSKLPSNIGMYFWSMGYDDKLTIAIGFSKDIIGDAVEGEKFVRFLKEELDTMDKGAFN